MSVRARVVHPRLKDLVISYPLWRGLTAATPGFDSPRRHSAQGPALMHKLPDWDQYMREGKKGESTANHVPSRQYKKGWPPKRGLRMRDEPKKQQQCEDRTLPAFLGSGFSAPFIREVKSHDNDSVLKQQISPVADILAWRNCQVGSSESGNSRTAFDARWWRSIPTRYMFAAEACFTILLMTYNSAGVPIAVTAMIYKVTVIGGDENDTDVCHEPVVNDTFIRKYFSSHHPVYEKDTKIFVWNCELHSVSDVVFDCCAHAHIGGRWGVRRDCQPGEFEWDGMTRTTVIAAGEIGMLFSYLVSARICEIFGTRYIVGFSFLINGGVACLQPTFIRLNVWLYVCGSVIPGFNILFTRWLVGKERMIVAALVFSAPKKPRGYCTVENNRLILTDTCFYVGQQIVPRAPWLKIIVSLPLWAHIAVSMSTAWINYTISIQLPLYLTKVFHFNIETTCPVASAIYVFRDPSIFVDAEGYFGRFLGNFSDMPAALPLDGGVVTIEPSSLIQRSHDYYKHTLLHRQQVRALEPKWRVTLSATVGPALMIIIIPQLKCDKVGVMNLLSITMFLNGAYLGGSFMNQLDISPNYAGSVAAFVSTLSGLIQVGGPLAAGALTNQEDTLTTWSKVFYNSSGISFFPVFLFLVFGSTSQQYWDKLDHNEADIPQRRKNKSVNTISIKFGSKYPQMETVD
uniref:Uncharacterized protein n=1 Tax=Timema shepardi TaxID=629360 RepID=A0A7R9AUQ9_TIMSH|nr:unnamed protein product [Timema shepardi]